MPKYSIVESRVKNGCLVDLEDKDSPIRKKIESKYVIYIYRNSRSKKVYIGQTKQFFERHRQHYSGSEEKFNTAKFDQVLIVASQLFNGTSLDDVESQLITYFAADCRKLRKTARNDADFDHTEVINRTSGNRVNEYAGREEVISDVILPLWEKVLYPKGWVVTETIDELKTQQLVKYSPIKTLTKEQSELITEIVSHPDKSYVINGDAGTGKTVLLTHLAARILKDRPDARVGVVVQPNWVDTGKEIFKVYGINNKNLTILTSSSMIKTCEKYDVIIVDEAHKMSRIYGKQHWSFNKVYEKKEFRGCKSHLEILQKMGGQIILMYDVLQAIRPANVTRKMFHYLTQGYEIKFLTTQFRIHAPKGKHYTSEDYINGIKYLLYKDTGLLDSGLTNYNPDFNREIFRDKSEDAYFGYVTEQPLHKLTDWLEEDLNFNPEHINRVLAGLVEDWKQSDGKDPKIKHWHEGDMSRRWNSTQKNWINSKDADAKEQIGSVFAVQGIDLNKVGVLIGKDLHVDEDGKLCADPDAFYNTNGTFTKEEMEDPENQFEFTLFVLNIYYVLLTRGIDGIRIGFWHNDDFRKYMEETLEINK